MEKLTCASCLFFIKNLRLTQKPLDRTERAAVRKNQFSWTNDKAFALGCYLGNWDENIEPPLIYKRHEIVTKDRKAREEDCIYFEYEEGLDLELARIAKQLRAESKEMNLKSPGTLSPVAYPKSTPQHKKYVGINLGTYRKILESEFTLQEVQTLCFDIGVQYQNLGSENTLEGRIRELIEYCDRHGRLLELLITTAKVRHRSSWHELWD